ncbi:hypothetical protein NDU88_007895 [Pleurodeles waltl]|uniref:Uncharacterized protein n=1 Tax=Pleurodeles waltl TaxID=8319 RepID=A0AAV7PQL4_PLEWA|nr:hypothetical protein NDU88_007895 [Pleurodeles waltl]
MQKRASMTEADEFEKSLADIDGNQQCETGSVPGIGAGRHRSSWTQKNSRLKKTPRPERKKPLLGGAERRRNRSRQKPLKTSADPGELCEGAVTLQEKRGLSRYGVRYKGKRAGGGRYEKGRGRENKGARHGEHWEEGKTKGHGTGALGRRKDGRERRIKTAKRVKYVY